MIVVMLIIIQTFMYVHVHICGGGWAARSGLKLPLRHRQQCYGAISLMSDRNRNNPLVKPRQSWQQFGTTHILINTFQWLHRPCSAPLWFDSVGKRLSVKPDLAIYNHMLGVSGHCCSVAFIFSNKLDFSFCVIWDGF